MTTNISHVADTLREMRAELFAARDNEISMASEVFSQYITDHNDKQAYRDMDKQVNKLARSWDRMIAKLDKWAGEAEEIEASCENFYGD